MAVEVEQCYTEGVPSVLTAFVTPLQTLSLHVTPRRRMPAGVLRA